MLIDEVEISVKAGDGGSGAVSFKRNAQTSRGGPDGGNGGNGGSIYFQGVNDISALRQFQFKKRIVADSGIPGKNNNLYGKNASDLVIKVPFGTQVTDEYSNSFEISNDSDLVLIARGGIGGKGNNSFKTATNQAPKFAEKGTGGEQKELKLVLHLIAEIGFVGLPNAGKSSLLKALTNANPKIGDYPFTTLEPNLGVLDGLTLADIPGLIEGASSGRGLGFKFLKHVEKTRAIIHLISLENSNLLKSYDEVNSELIKYEPKLSKKTKLIIATKKDLFSEEEVKEKLKSLDSLKIEIIPFSVYDLNDIQNLKNKIVSLVNE